MQGIQADKHLITVISVHVSTGKCLRSGISTGIKLLLPVNVLKCLIIYQQVSAMILRNKHSNIFLSRRPSGCQG